MSQRKTYPAKLELRARYSNASFQLSTIDNASESGEGVERRVDGRAESEHVFT